jgi:hypothetical protein
VKAAILEKAGLRAPFVGFRLRRRGWDCLLPKKPMIDSSNAHITLDARIGQFVDGDTLDIRGLEVKA